MQNNNTPYSSGPYAEDFLSNSILSFFFNSFGDIEKMKKECQCLDAFDGLSSCVVITTSRLYPTTHVTKSIRIIICTRTSVVYSGVFLPERTRQLPRDPTLRGTQIVISNSPICMRKIDVCEVNPSHLVQFVPNKL